MRVTLNEQELRVLGVLIEKSLTQPAGYPLTLNAITSAANQLHNRDPVAQYGEMDVSAAIRTLIHKKAAAQAPPAAGARAIRFQHRVNELFGWDKRQQAIMAELMLRGRQTAGELRSRASRMMPFDDVEAVSVTLNELMSGGAPFVQELPREPGRSANRFRHLLADESSEPSSKPPQTAEPAIPQRSPSADVSDTTTKPSGGHDELSGRMARLEEEVALIARRLERLEAGGVGRVDADADVGVP